MRLSQGLLKKLLEYLSLTVAQQNLRFMKYQINVHIYYWKLERNSVLKFESHRRSDLETFDKVIIIHFFLESKRALPSNFILPLGFVPSEVSSTWREDHGEALMRAKLFEKYVRNDEKAVVRSAI